MIPTPKDHTACPRPCNECPWLTKNHGKPHPHGWYTKLNLARLWSKLRRGDSMSCHKTDIENPVPPGHEPPKPGTVVRECTGGLILQQREVMKAQDVGSWKEYVAANTRGLTRTGLGQMLQRAMLGGVFGVARMSRPDLNEAVSHEPLGTWTPRAPKDAP